MAGMTRPTSPRTTPLLLVSFGGPEKPEDVVPFLENVTRGRGIPRERLEEVGRALLPLRRPLADQRPEPRLPRRAARADLAGAGHRPARLLGQPQLGPLPHRHRAADGRRRGHPGGLLRDQRLLVVLLVPAVPREPLRRGRCRRSRAPRSRQAAPLLQPPRLRGADGRRDPRGAGRPARGRPRRRPPGVRHPLDPDRDERRQRPPEPGGGAYVAQHLDVAAEVAERVGEETGAGTRTSWSSARAPAPRTSRGSSPTSTTTSRRCTPTACRRW